MKPIVKIILVITACSILVACGNGKRNIPLNIQSDPLGAYALLQIKYKGDENSDWIWLGPTPIVLDKSLRFENASSVSLKVVRPGFYEQVKTWKAKDFVKDYKKNGKITWVPNMVQQ